MSCVTCETTPPPEKLSPTPVHEGHIGVRFGQAGLGWCILYRGRDVTDQTIEAHAGDEQNGWVELRPIRESDGAPIIHPAGPVTGLRCNGCGKENPLTEPVDRIEIDNPTCPDCEGEIQPVTRHPAHAMTIIRPGDTRILRGAQILTGNDSSRGT